MPAFHLIEPFCVCVQTRQTALRRRLRLILHLQTARQTWVGKSARFSAFVPSLSVGSVLIKYCWHTCLLMWHYTHVELESCPRAITTITSIQLSLHYVSSRYLLCSFDQLLGILFIGGARAWQQDWQRFLMFKNGCKYVIYNANGNALKTLEIQITQYSTVTETPPQDFNILDISDSQHIILLKKFECKSWQTTTHCRFLNFFLAFWKPEATVKQPRLTGSSFILGFGNRYIPPKGPRERPADWTWVDFTLPVVRRQRWKEMDSPGQSPPVGPIRKNQ